MMNQYVHKNNYEVTQLDDEWLILNTDNFTVTKLNALGGFCWSLLHEAQTIDSIIEAIKKNYDLTNENVRQDIDVFLSDLIQCGLIENAK